MIILQFRGLQLFLIELFLSQQQERRVADFGNRIRWQRLVRLIPRPADIFAQETAQRAEQVGEVFDLACANVFAARA